MKVYSANAIDIALIENYQREGAISLHRQLMFFFLVVFVAQVSAAQELTPPQSDDIDEPIVVTGQRQSEIDAVRQGIDRIFSSDSPSDPVARFIDPVCLGFAGLDTRQQATFREMIEFRGKNAGVNFAQSECKTNALVVIVDDPETFVSEVRSEQPKFMPVNEQRKFDAGMLRGDPVFAWSSQEVRTAFGRPAPHSATIPGLTLPMAVATKVNTDARARRVGLNQSAALINSIVIFDARKLDGLTLVQLADYAAMRLLAPSKIPAKWQGDRPESILRLFSPNTDEVELSMTVFDESYLSAVYNLPLNASPSRLRPKVVADYVRRSKD